MKLNRPTKEMMLAINAQLAGDSRQAESLIREHSLNRKEMEFRIEKRGGEKYDFSRKGGKRRGGKGRVIAEASAPSRDILSLIDGRTKIATLVRLEGRIDEILAKRNGRDVSRVREAMKNISVLRRKLEAAEKALSD
jgi:hypothetical protein